MQLSIKKNQENYMTQNLKLVVFVVFLSFIGISLGGWQDKIPKLKIPEPKIPKPKIPKPKIPKPKIPKVPKYPRLKYSKSQNTQALKYFGYF